MFDIGIQELIVIFVVALIVFGPEKLPEVGRTLGKWMIEIRRGIQSAKLQMDSEIDELEKKNTPNPEQSGPEEKPAGSEAASSDESESSHKEKEKA